MNSSGDITENKSAVIAFGYMSSTSPRNVPTSSEGAGFRHRISAVGSIVASHTDDAELLGFGKEEENERRKEDKDSIVRLATLTER